MASRSQRDDSGGVGCATGVGISHYFVSRKAKLLLRWLHRDKRKAPPISTTRHDRFDSKGARIPPPLLDQRHRRDRSEQPDPPLGPPSLHAPSLPLRLAYAILRPPCGRVRSHSHVAHVELVRACGRQPDADVVYGLRPEEEDGSEGLHKGLVVLPCHHAEMKKRARPVVVDMCFTVGVVATSVVLGSLLVRVVS